MTDLSKLLANWEPEVPETPAFRRNVWDRIAISATRSKSDFVLGIEAFLIFISRPRIAFATACAVVLLGAAVGGNLSAQSESGESAYLRAMNPYAQAASR
jgi:hypothetical protein